MPNLAKLAGEGRTADLKSFAPTVSPMVWTTIATGAEPQDHGVLDFFEVDPVSGQQAPVSARFQRVPAFWTLASARGLTAGVVNYWATHPAEEIRGFVVTDRACPWLVDVDPAQLPSAVSPPSQVEMLRRTLDAHPLPDAAAARRYGDFTDAELASSSGLLFRRLLRNTEVIEESAETLFDDARPEVFALYFPGTDEVAHLYGLAAAPRMPCVAPDVFARLSAVVPRYYSLADQFLGRWMQRAARDGRTLLLVSDHGFRWGDRRACAVNKVELSNSATQHRGVGIAAAWGRNVVPSRHRDVLSVFDVSPTILALLGLPVDRKAPGRARVEWFRGVTAPVRGEVWSAARPPKRLPFVAPRGDEYAEHLRSLGYLAGGPPATRGDGSETITATGWHAMGCYWEDRGRPDRAVEAFQHALAAWPGYPASTIKLVECLAAEGRGTEAVSVARSALDHPSENLGWTIYELASLLEAKGFVSAEAELLHEALKRLPDSEPVVASVAGLELNQGRCQSAFDRVSRFLAAEPSPDTLNVAGLALACLHRRAEARRLLSTSLALVPDQPEIRRTLRSL